MIGTTLAHYRITAPLGKGGMGEVYRATDTKLGRDVALKILPTGFAQDPERVARFEREARTLAAVQHPNIASIYGFEHTEAQRFLVMELAEGEDLSARVRGGPIPVDEALDIAYQIASGLEAAHEKNVVHRDLKPANIKVGPNGQVKILDFGLAMVFAERPSEQDLEHSPTISAGITGKGVILGTAAYMSPEQARGKEVDRRTDMWAFGCVLYEMLTGTRIFAGETLSDSIGAILHKEIELAKLPPQTPPAVAHLITRCLIKDPNKRLRDAGDARSEIELARDGSSTGLHVLPSHAFEQLGRSRRMHAGWLVLALVVGVGLGALGWSLRGGAAAPREVRKFDLGVELSLSALPEVQAAISPDGSQVLFSNEGKLWVQALEQLDPRTVEGAEGADRPFWSPDSREIGYFSSRGLYRIPVAGGRPVQLTAFAEAPTGGHRGSWGSDDQIVYSEGRAGLMRIPGRGGMPSVLVPLRSDEGDLHDPLVLPDDRGVVFAAHLVGGGAHRLDVQTRDGERKVLWTSPNEDEALRDPVYDPAGYLVVQRTRGDVTEGLWAFPFSLESLEVTGEPVLIVASASSPSVGGDGTLAFIAGHSGGTGNQKLVWYSRDGTRQEAGGGTHVALSELRLSPDGRQLLFQDIDTESNQHDLWVLDLERNTQIRLTNDTRIEYSPTWFPSGDQISYLPFRVGMRVGDVRTTRIYADGSGSPSQYLDKMVAADRSRDGRFTVVFAIDAPDSANLIPTLPIRIGYLDAEAGDAVQWNTDAAPNRFPRRLSPDGRWLLIESSDNGIELKVYLTRFPEMERRWLVSSGNGAGSAWHPDGDRIYYIQDSSIVELPFEVIDGQPRFGRPVTLFEIPSHPIRDFGTPPRVVLSADGERFLVVDYAGKANDQRPRVKIVQNWSAELR